MLRSQANRVALRNFLSGLVVGSLGGGLSYWALAPASPARSSIDYQNAQKKEELEVDKSEPKTGEDAVMCWLHQQVLSYEFMVLRWEKSIK